MNIIDNNGIQFVIENHLVLQNEYYMAPDIEEEAEMLRLVTGAPIPMNISSVKSHRTFDEAVYLDCYRESLNRYAGRSFFNMRGFGDISILSCLHMFGVVYQRQSTQELFPVNEHIVVFTKDTGLKKRIEKDFDKKNVTVKPVTSIH